MLKVLQLNCNRSRAPHSLLEEIATRRGADLLLLSEPNRNLARSKVAWVTDADADTAIIDCTGIITRHGSGKGFSWAEVGKAGRFYSCYASPNAPIEELEAFLSELRSSIRGAVNLPVYVCGDFNAASTEWGSTVIDGRGHKLLEWMAELDLTTVNDGVEPTFVGTRGSSFVDLTMAQTTQATRISGWQVLTNEITLSDHQTIEFYVDAPLPPRPRPRDKLRFQGRVSTIEAIRTELARSGAPADAEGLQRLLESACATARVHPKRRHQVSPKHWWTEEIAGRRRDCLRARREVKTLRSLVGDNDDRMARAVGELRKCRALLRREIAKSRERAWKEFLDSVEQDTWGKPYKLVRGKIKGRCETTLTTDERKAALEQLFPRQPEFDRTPYERPLTPDEEAPPVTRAEIILAAERIKPGKAPGEDGVPPAATRVLLKEFPDMVAEVFTGLIRRGAFPTSWKRAEVVLLPKGNGSFRPICLLGTLAKAFEAVIEARLRRHAEEFGLLSDGQFGFRKNRSVLSPIHRVLSKAETLRKATRKTRELYLVILLDVRNAFNSLPWKVILRTLRARRVPQYLTRMISDYLKERDLTSAGTELTMTAGVPQGSILGPLLWNLAYDGVLRLRDLPPGVDLLAYADDVAVTVQARSPGELETKANLALWEISLWMRQNGLELAPEKTEAALLVGKKACRDLDIRLDGTAIKTSKVVRYLGMHLDRGLRGSPHIRIAAAKTTKAAGQLARIMPNIRGPKEGKRRLLASVGESIMLFGAPVWAESTLRTECNRNTMMKAQRILALRTVQAYRDVNGEAACVLAGTTPWDLKAEERRRKWADPTLAAEQQKAETLLAWQARWDTVVGNRPGASTREIIPDIGEWINRPGGGTTYFMTQFLTGHGDFKQYLARFKDIAESCTLCPACDVDSPLHTLLLCSALQDVRAERMDQQLARELGAHGMRGFVRYICASEEHWHKGAQLAEELLKRKDHLERARIARLAATAAQQT